MWEVTYEGGLVRVRDRPSLEGREVACKPDGARVRVAGPVGSDHWAALADGSGFMLTRSGDGRILLVRRPDLASGRTRAIPKPRIRTASSSSLPLSSTSGLDSVCLSQLSSQSQSLLSHDRRRAGIAIGYHTARSDESPDETRRPLSTYLYLPAPIALPNLGS